jgi:type I restriction enzyme, S subunit
MKSQKFKQTEIGKIPEDWEEKALKEICEKIISGGTPLTNRPEYYKGDIHWLRTQEINFNRIYETERKITKLGLSNSSAKLIPVNSIIVAMYGATAGKVAINKILLATNQACCNLVINPILTDYEYVYYYLMNKYEWLLSQATGAAQQNLNIRQVSNISLPLPPLPEQIAIAKILSSLDEKIELNNKMNKTLEAIGQTIFKKWFIDNPEKEGWEERGLDEIADFLNGLALQKFTAKNREKYLPVIKIRELRNGITDQTDKASFNLPPEYIVNDGDILFSWSGSLEVVIWTKGRGALNQHLFKVTSNKYPKWFYYYWIKEHLPEFQQIAKGKATTMGHIQRNHLSSAKVFIPDKNVLEYLSHLMNALIDKLIILNIQNQTLSQIRDTLLPKLMSGEIRVK